MKATDGKSMSVSWEDVIESLETYSVQKTSPDSTLWQSNQEGFVSYKLKPIRQLSKDLTNSLLSAIVAIKFLWSVGRGTTDKDQSSTDIIRTER